MGDSPSRPHERRVIEGGCGVLANATQKPLAATTIREGLRRSAEREAEKRSQQLCYLSRVHTDIFTGRQASLRMIMTFTMAKSLRIQAVKATFGSLPRLIKRS
jgi:uncharacterized protein (DUF924 family)